MCSRLCRLRPSSPQLTKRWTCHPSLPRLIGVRISDPAPVHEFSQARRSLIAAGHRYKFHGKDMESVVMNEVQFLIDVLYPAAQAAYAIMSVPTPPLTWPAGYTLVSAIHADPQKAAAAMAAANPDAQRLANETVIESSI